MDDGNTVSSFESCKETNYFQANKDTPTVSSRKKSGVSSARREFIFSTPKLNEMIKVGSRLKMLDGDSLSIKNTREIKSAFSINNKGLGKFTKSVSQMGIVFQAPS